MLKTVRSTVNVDQITGVLPVVNGGTGVTTSTGTGSVVLSAAPTLSGNVGLSTGNIVPATAAKGINFTANTPAAGMTSQLLNKYEEGVVTLTLAGCTTSPSFTVNYTKIGRTVTLTCVSAALGAVSNSTAKSLSSLSGTGCEPSIPVVFTGLGGDGASPNYIMVVFVLAANGVISLYPTPSYNLWTPTGNFYLEKFTVTYSV